MNHQEIELEQKLLNERFVEMISNFLPLKKYAAQICIKQVSGFVEVAIENLDNPGKLMDLSTRECEITFFFSEFHSHFDWLSSADQEGMFEDFQCFLEKFLNDQILVVECYNGGQCTLGAMVENMGELPQLDASQVEIRSWSGKRDSTIIR